MLDLFRDPMWQGIGAILTFLSFAVYVFREWKEIVKRWGKSKKFLGKILAVFPRRLSLLTTLLLLVGLAGLFLLVINPLSPPSPVKVGRPIGNVSSFSIGRDYYHPSGIMGDIGDVRIARPADLDRFSYETLGRGPREWDLKCRYGKLNPEPAQFAGVMYLDPPGNWGNQPGFDLRGVRRVLNWEARSTSPVIVEFIIGGVNRIWDEKEECKSVVPEWQDSMPRTVVGRGTLAEDWQSFQYEFTNMPANNFANLIGGFAWVVEWGAIQVELNQERTGPVCIKTFSIEIRNIRYER